MTDNPQQPPESGDPYLPPPSGDPHRPPYPQQPYGQQQPGQQQPYGQPGWPPGEEPPYGRPGETIGDPTAYPGNEVPPDRTVQHLPPSSAGGFFGALFDYSFTRYITPTIVKVVYVIVTVLVALAWLVGIVAAFNATVMSGVLFLLFGWIVALVYLAIARITLEFFVAVISVSEKVNRYAERDGV